MRSNDPFRGIIMILASAIALWKGWQIHQGRMAFAAYSLAGIALALGIWHFLRNSAGQRS